MRCLTKTIYCYEHACEIYGSEIVDGLRAGTLTVQEAMQMDSRNKNVKRGKNYDAYNVYDYDDPDDFADDYADEFDDDYEYGYEDAYDYWEDAHE